MDCFFNSLKKTLTKEVTMLDLPLDTFQKNQTEIEQIVAHVSKNRELLDFSIPIKSRDVTDVTDPLYIQAKAIVDAMDTMFTWQELAHVLKESFHVVQLNQSLTIDEQKQHVTKILDYVIDLTDTPYLPDSWSDPLFKMLVPPIIDLVSKAFNGQLVPILSNAPPSPETFKLFIEKTKTTFADGFQWSDLGVCIENAILFVGGFPSLTLEEKKQSVIDILDTIIDITDTPIVPDSITDPIFKAMVPPLVNFVFDKL